MKNSFLKRTLCFALALVTLLALTACGAKPETAETEAPAQGTEAQAASNFNPTGLPIVNEPVEFTIFYSPASAMPTLPMADKAFFQKMEQETNVKINWIEVPNSAGLEKLNLIMNSGDLPDAIMGSSFEKMIGDAIVAGQVQPIDDLLQYAPNTRKLLDLYPEVKNAMTYVGDDKLYSFPGAAQTNESRVGNPMFINKVWLDKLGLEMPTTTAELMEVFKAFKEGDPNGNGIADEVPMGLCKAWFGQEVYRMLPLWEMQPPIMSPIDASIRDGKLEYNPVTRNYRDFLDFMHTCYANGYMEAEALTQDMNTLKAKAAGDVATYGFFFAWSPELVVGTELVDEYELLLPVESPYGRRIFNTTKDTKPVQCSYALSILTPCEQPEVLARWYDYMMDGIHSLELYAGEEGTGFVLDEENKSWKPNDERLAELGVSFDEYRVKYGVQMTLGTIIPDVIGYTQVIEPSSLVARKEVWSKAYDPYAMSLDEMWPYTKPIDVASEESQEIALLHTDLRNYNDTFVADAIMNGLDDEKWENHLSDCEKYQYQQVLEYYQEQYDKYKY